MEKAKSAFSLSFCTEYSVPDSNCLGCCVNTALNFGTEYRITAHADVPSELAEYVSPIV